MRMLKVGTRPNRFSSKYSLRIYALHYIMFLHHSAPHCMFQSDLHTTNIFSATNRTLIKEIDVIVWNICGIKTKVRVLIVRYLFHIFITQVSPSLPFPSPAHPCPPSFPTLTSVTTNSELNYILALQITHFQTRTSVRKWKLHVSMENSLRASQNK